MPNKITRYTPVESATRAGLTPCLHEHVGWLPSATESSVPTTETAGRPWHFSRTACYFSPVDQIIRARYISAIPQRRVGKNYTSKAPIDRHTRASQPAQPHNYTRTATRATVLRQRHVVQCCPSIGTVYVRDARSAIGSNTPQSRLITKLSRLPPSRIEVWETPSPVMHRASPTSQAYSLERSSKQETQNQVVSMLTGTYAAVDREILLPFSGFI